MFEMSKSRANSNMIVATVFGITGTVFMLMLLNVMRVKTSTHHWNIMKTNAIERKKRMKLDRKTLKKIRLFTKFALTTLKTFVGYVQILSVSDTAFKIPGHRVFCLFCVC